MASHSPGAKRSDIDVFGYLDYRAYLRDYYNEQKARGRGFSYRVFARRAALRSPNYMKLVIDGERSLTPEMAARFARACGLDGEAAEYFVDLVGFNQARAGAERNARYAKLTGFRRYRSAHKLELAQDEYHSRWYLPAIRELAARSDFREDPEWIARTLQPPITPRRAKSALRTLQRLGLLVRDSRGRLQQAEVLVSTGPETASMRVANYHHTMIAQAAASIHGIAQTQRDISSLTLCVGADGFQRLKQRVQRFRRELLEMSALEDDPEQVVQVNFQIFPLSAGRDEESP